MTGIIVLDKAGGITSQAAVSRIKRILGIKKCGHGGTLDPMATGVLPIFLGKATKACEFVLDGNKEYLASFILGYETDTQDITGKTLAISDKRPDIEDIKEAILSFKGKITQTPPMYSALKVDGKKLYELAREGKTVERQAREHIVYNIEYTGRGKEDEYYIKLLSSKGLYVRTICHDLGRKLGSYAVMSSLRRTKAGIFEIENAYTLEEIEKMTQSGDFSFIMPLDSLFKKYPDIYLNETDEKKFRNGQFLDYTADGGLYRIYSKSGEFLALGEVNKALLKSKKAFYTQNSGKEVSRGTS